MNKTGKRILGIAVLIVLASLVLAGAGAAHEDHNDLVWTEWTATDSLPSTAGNYYLTDNVNLTESWHPVNGTNLCLNGHNVTMTAGQVEGHSVINIGDGVSFGLYDCAATPGKITGGYAVNGGGVYMSANAGTFTMYGGEISGNSARDNGGGVMVLGGNFVRKGGVVKNNGTASNIYIDGWTPIQSESDLNTLFNKGGKGFLTRNLNGSWLTYEEVTLDLCGYNLIHDSDGDQYAVLRTAGTLNLYDSGGEGFIMREYSLEVIGDACGGVKVKDGGTFNFYGGTIKDTHVHYHGAGVYVNKGTFNMYDGAKIENCSADPVIGLNTRGGGVYLHKNATFNMYGGIIENCSASNGGGVYAFGANFEMSGGKIINCTAEIDGGGVYIEEYDVSPHYYAGSFTMSDDAVIDGCSAGDKAGGVYVEVDLSFTMNGGKIINCTSARNGAGVNWANAEFTRNGGYIKDNTYTDGTSGNLYHNLTYNISYNGIDGATVTNPTTITSEADITLNNPVKSGYTFTGWTGSHVSNPTVNLVVDCGYPGDRTFTANWELNTYTVSFDVQGHGTAPESYTEVASGEKISEPAAPTAEGYTFGGWYKEAECTNAWDFTNDTVTANITLYAKWIQNPTIAVDKEKIYWGDSVQLTTEAQSGYTNLQFQYKTGSSDWMDIAGATVSPYFFTPEAGTYDLRAKVTYGTISINTNVEEVTVTPITVSFQSNNTLGSVSPDSITNLKLGDTIILSGTDNSTLTIKRGDSEIGTCTATPETSLNAAFYGWVTDDGVVIETSSTLEEDMTITAYFSLDNALYISSNVINYGTLNVGDNLPSERIVYVTNKLDSTVRADWEKSENFTYKVRGTSFSGSYITINPNETVAINVNVKGVKKGDYYDTITFSRADNEILDTMMISLSVIDDPEETGENVTTPITPKMIITRGVDGEDFNRLNIIVGNNGTIVSGDGKVTIKPVSGSKSNVEIAITSQNVKMISDKVVSIDEVPTKIEVSYPVSDLDSSSQTSVGDYTTSLTVKTINGLLPNLTGEYKTSVASIVTGAGYSPITMVSSVNEDIETINKNIDTTTMSITVPKSALPVDNYSKVKMLHVTDKGIVRELITNYDITNGNVTFTGTYNGGFSSYVLAVDIPKTTGGKSSTVTSFIGEKDGNEFIYDRAVVIIRAVLPGAESSTITNISGKGWYNFNLSAPGFIGNGTVYFQVPLDVIEIKGWTVNDVSFLGSTTKYLGTIGSYAKYVANVEKEGNYSIDFEKDAAAKTVETQPVTETKKEDTTPVTTTRDDSSSTTQKTTETVKTTATTEKTTTEQKQTATKSPFPVLGILAGIGAAGVLALRRK